MLAAKKHNGDVVVKKILYRISCCLIAIVLLQSCKLLWITQYAFSSDDFRIHYHLYNLFIHLSFFISVILAINCDKLGVAKYILICSFASFIINACILWEVNLHLQYYFLLSMFICTYVFNSKEEAILYVALCMNAFFFMYFQISLSDSDTSKRPEFYDSIKMTNNIVFSISCIVCALYIRRIITQNSLELAQFQHYQNNILSKLFPQQLMPMPVNASGNGQMTNTSLFSFTKYFKNIFLKPPAPLTSFQLEAVSMNKLLGVIFVDICNFTAMQMNQHDSSDTCHNIHQLFAKFDSALLPFSAKRIKTNGDQYIVIIGFSEKVTQQELIAQHTYEACIILHDLAFCQLKIGAAMGEVRCGVFDPMHPSFDIWGETVIRAARLESIAKADETLIDHQIFSFINANPPSFNKKKVDLKGLGEHEIFSTFIE